uniref:Putative ovule protein n=1 Tax=Solanum chacoense TaxID=4108 RepID=A0A0V0HPP8_SOLCH
MFVPRFSGDADATQRVGFFGPSCTLHTLALMRMTGFHFLRSTLMAKLLPGSIAYFATSYFWIGSISMVNLFSDFDNKPTMMW